MDDLLSNGVPKDNVDRNWCDGWSLTCRSRCCMIVQWCCELLTLIWSISSRYSEDLDTTLEGPLSSSSNIRLNSKSSSFDIVPALSP
uniref:Uncharacterized protein n=1 Tax=Tanacetum cinerariifolium TaxID=118510 RepID=A0A699VCH9_TANCI|nr:hypothetical protein [Tanacetum cinerariifolium]